MKCKECIHYKDDKNLKCELCPIGHGLPNVVKSPSMPKVRPPKDEKPEYCQDCKYYKILDGPTDDDVFSGNRCRRYPRQVNFDADGIRHDSFPVALPGEWCGEWRIKND